MKNNLLRFLNDRECFLYLHLRNKFIQIFVFLILKTYNYVSRKDFCKHFVYGKLVIFKYKENNDNVYTY
jgi:hypothetical protein